MVYICTNQGIIATLRAIKAILDHLEHKDNIEVRKINVNKLLNCVEKYVMPIIIYLANAPPKTLKEFKEKYGEGGYKRSTLALFRIIHEEIPNFNPPGLKEYLKKVDTSNNSEAYDCLLKRYLPHP